MYKTFMCPDVASITLDVTLIPLITYETAQTCAWWHMVRWQKKCANREWLWEGIKHTEIVCT